MATVQSSHWSYDLLKKLASEDTQLNSEFNEYKDDFGIEARRSACITNVRDLLDYLERRDELSECNVESLEHLAERCNNVNLLEAVKNYTPPTELPVGVNQYRELRFAEHLQQKLNISGTTATLTPIGATASPRTVAAPAYDDNKRRQVYKLLGQQLGSYWRRFGRELEVSEGAMDEIELRFTHDLTSRIYDVLTRFQEDAGHSPGQELTLIYRALEQCQRKDLRRKVENIMSY